MQHKRKRNEGIEGTAMRRDRHESTKRLNLVVDLGQLKPLMKQLEHQLKILNVLYNYITLIKQEIYISNVNKFISD